ADDRSLWFLDSHPGEERCTMRSHLFLATLAFILVPLAAEAEENPGPPLLAREAKKLFKPDTFQTLVNPNCSHCVDEAKRRAGELRRDDRVLAWIRGKYEGGGIPLRFFLVPYRVISDTYGVFVYDADAGFVRGFEASLDFTFHGWRNGIMVIRHKDGTLFSTLSGRAFDGPRQGQQLIPIATLETDWDFWSTAYPGSVAYHMFEKYQPTELPDDENGDAASTRLEANPREIPGETRVVGVALGDEAKAWSLTALEAAGGLIEDNVGGQKLVVLWYSPTQTAAIYAPQIEESEPPLTVSLVCDRALARDRAPFRDRNTESRFGIEGRAVDGPLKGNTLRWLSGVQCRWFAWAAEYPQTKLHVERSDAAPAKPADNDAKRADKKRPRKPLSAAIVQPDFVSAEQVAVWRRDGYQAVVVVLDERHSAEEYRRAAAVLAAAKLDLYYWIEVARNPEMAAAHPEWMASLGVHDDWQKRFPKIPLPKEGQVAKALPWVPILYREAYDAHLERIGRLLRRASGDYHGLLINDLQGGPASCGCGNLQCRWATDYGVESTTTKLEGDDIARRFLTEVRELAPDKQVIPVWMTECEDRDLPADRRPAGKTTGYCGGVGCSQGTCPKAFSNQWNALVRNHEGPIGLLVTHRELGREGEEYGDTAGWIAQAVDYIDQVPPRHGGIPVAHERLWLVVQGYDVPSATVEAARQAATLTGAGAVLVAQTRLDATYEPRVIAVK
ncbi:MAG TPA: DUF3179 domain-containing (seleno)protein, partial [Pirellulales bacterium]|nr:DUF3179 domain-containing (seleno)protein [Pirellulales bacterium]